MDAADFDRLKKSQHGLILIRSEDLFSTLIRSISGQEYNTIGFYYTDQLKHQVCLIIADLSHIGVENYFTQTTLGKLAENPLISKIAYKGLKKIEAEKFRVAISKLTLKLYDKAGFKRSIKQLFGYEEVSCDMKEDGMTAIEMINSVMQELNVISGCHCDIEEEKVDADILKILPDEEIKSKTDLVEKLSQSLRSVTYAKLIQSYIDNETIFRRTEVIMHKKKSSEVQMAAMEYYQMHKKLLIDFTKVFVELIFEDDKFYQIIIRNIQRSCKTNSIPAKFVKSILLDNYNANRAVIEFMFQLCGGEFDADQYDEVLTELIAVQNQNAIVCKRPTIVYESEEEKVSYSLTEIAERIKTFGTVTGTGLDEIFTMVASAAGLTGIESCALQMTGMYST